ncbi:MAG: hypothetical protein GY719_00080 [bacterium]|nr:hypothetical protein [bacterium]
MEKEAHRSARRGRRIVLGTAELPYEPLVLDGAPLSALRAFEGLEVAITTSSPEIAEHLDLLIELDRRHAVSVDMLLACLDPDSTDLSERLRAVSSLGADGITTRVVAAEPADLPGGQLARPAAERRLRRLFETVRDVPVFDVAATPADAEELRHGEWHRVLQRLRFEHGFPRRLPGRG